MILLQTHSGLANRIRVIISGLSFAKKVNQPLVIYWNKDSGLNCGFYTLFEKNDQIIVKKFDLRIRILDLMKSSGILRKLFYKIYRIDFTLFDSDFKNYVWKTNSDLIDLSMVPKNVRNYYINTCNEFFFHQECLRHLKPVNHIQNLINKEVGNFPKNTIGIHIRRTDNKISIEESPINLFIKKMHEDLIDDKTTHYFLATDDPSVENDLVTLFPSKIIIAKKQFTRNSQEGIIGAMVDMYCLAATKKIYGSYFSSFSSIAARIGNIPLIVIKK